KMRTSISPPYAAVQVTTIGLMLSSRLQFTSPTRSAFEQVTRPWSTAMDVSSHRPSLHISMRAPLISVLDAETGTSLTVPLRATTDPFPAPVRVQPSSNGAVATTTTSPSRITAVVIRACGATEPSFPEAQPAYLDFRRIANEENDVVAG